MRFYLFFILFILSVGLAKANRPNLKFRSISPPGGYTFEGIRYITQDNDGFIWFASMYDVFKYNNKKVSHFKIEHSDSLRSIGANCSGLVSDNNGLIWLGTNRGLKYFNHTTQSFQDYKYKHDLPSALSSRISCIELDKQGKLWIIDSNGIGKLNPITKTVNYIKNIPQNFTPKYIYFKDNKTAYVSSIEGDIYLLDLVSSQFEFFNKRPGYLVTDIMIDGDNIWIGYRNHGLHLYDVKGKEIKHYTCPIKPKVDLSRSEIRSIYKDSNGNIWIASYHGLFVLKNNEIFRYIPEDYPGLPHRSTYSFFEDRTGAVWIGTWNGGIAYQNHSDNIFEYFGHSKTPYSLSNNVVSSFTNHNGNIYVGTEVEGLNMFDVKKKEFHQVNMRPHRKDIINIKCLETDKSGTLWVGTYRNGLWYKKKNQPFFKNIAWDLKNIYKSISSSIHSLHATDSGLWIGSDSDGFGFYNYNTKKFQSQSVLFTELEFKKKYTDSKILVSDSLLWVTCNEGITQLSLNNKKTLINKDSYPGITDLMCFCVFKSNNEKIWIGTKNNGAIVYNPILKVFEKFDAGGILKGKDVYGFEEDNNKNLWITSNVGLIVYNYENKTFRQFLKIDGIQGNIFNPQSIFKDNAGKLYFGGTNGYTTVEPKQIRRNNTPPNVMLNHITINNHRRIYHLETNNKKMAELKLKSYETSLRFDFSTDNYLLPQKNKFKYRLLPFNNSWIDADWHGEAVFTNLQGGDYIFEVMSANNDGIWNTAPLKINIHIDMPWYKRRIAFFAYAVIIITLALLVFHTINERLNLKRAVLIEKIQRENEEKIHQGKLRFFTNISHEFRTPLTLIAGPIKKLVDASNFNNEQQNSLDIINRNTNRLLSLVNQTLDIRKIEMTPSQLNLTSFNFISFANNIFKNFEKLIEDRELKVEYNCDIRELIIEADQEKVDKIIFNLLSNAFKFTPKQGWLKITIKECSQPLLFEETDSLRYGLLSSEKYLQFQITNSSLPLKTENWIKIFDRYETGSTNTKTSTGIGLSMCKDYTLVHSGEIIAQQKENEITFTLHLPINHNNYNIDPLKTKEISLPKEISKTQNHLGDNENNKIHILIVEDNEDLRQYVVQLLKGKFIVHEAENGKIAVKLIEDTHIDLIISDVMMPEMNGFEFCQHLKSNLLSSHIPIIMLTALTSTENKITGLDIGADAYISKPFEDSLLLSQVNNLLSQRKTLREAFQKHIEDDEPFNAGNIENYFLKKLDDIIEKNLTDESFSVNLIASEVGMSRSQLFRKLSQLTPYNPTEYIKVFKLKKSKELLLEDKYPMDEIAYLTGFSSSSYFTKSFKSVYGQTPTQWRKTQLGSA